MTYVVQSLAHADLDNHTFVGAYMHACLQAEEAWREKQAAEVKSRRAARTIQKSWHAYKVKADAEKKKAAAADKKKGKGAAKGKKK